MKTVNYSLRPMLDKDFEKYDLIQNHAFRFDLLESKSTFHSKIQAFSKGCWIIEENQQAAAYLIVHPWILNSIVPLDLEPFLIPQQPQCLYIHSLAVHSKWRNCNFGRYLIQKAFEIADELHLPTITLVSVQQSDSFWKHFGFHTINQIPINLANELEYYGSDAKFMVFHNAKV